MTYYINPIWFYLISIADDLDIVVTFAAILLGILSVVGLINYFIMDSDGDQDAKDFFKAVKKIFIAGLICSLMACAIPNKITCQEMLIASIATKENVQELGQSTEEFVDYIIDAVDELNSKGDK